MLPLQAVYSVCRLSEDLGTPVAPIQFVHNACLSLVSVLVTSDKSSNQELAQRMLATGCRLLGMMESGITDLLKKAVEMMNPGNYGFPKIARLPSSILDY